MLGHYLTKHPAIYDTIMDMIDEYRAVVNSYNKAVGLEDIAARILRPDDQIIGKAAEVYEATSVDAVDQFIYLMAASLRVPAGQGVLHLGWHCAGDLGGDGILEVDLEGIKRQEVCARWAYMGEFHNYTFWETLHLLDDNYTNLQSRKIKTLMALTDNVKILFKGRRIINNN